MENQTTLGPKENKPNQTQFQTRHILIDRKTQGPVFDCLCALGQLYSPNRYEAFLKARKINAQM
jgi:hypothetical protein